MKNLFSIILHIFLLKYYACLSTVCVASVGASNKAQTDVLTACMHVDS